LGVASCFYTGLEVVKVMDHLGIPADRWRILGVLSFGYPAKKLRGRKTRKLLEEVASRNLFGTPLSG
ncbi:MAG: nitroreductase family protein, partial [Conexivisphaera sp.]